MKLPGGLLSARLSVSLLSGWVALSVGPGLSAAPPNRTVCVTGDGSPFANQAEGYERKRAAQDLAASPARINSAIFQVGGKLQDCLANVISGDQLVLITHGDTGSFTWNDGTGNGDDTYADFTALPLPGRFSALTNVGVTFTASHSCAQPADGSDQRSSCSKILDAMNGGNQSTGNTCTGFDNVPFGFYAIDVDAVDPNNPPTSQQNSAAQKCAADDLFNNAEEGISWANNPPAGRTPEGSPNQFDGLQQTISLCPGTGGMVKLTKLLYYPTKDVVTGMPPRKCAP